LRAPYRAGLCWYAGLLHASPNVCAKRPLEHGTKQCCSTGLREPRGLRPSYASPNGSARISQSSAPSPAKGPRRELREGGRSKIRIFRIQYSSSLSGPCTCISPEGLVLQVRRWLPAFLVQRTCMVRSCRLAKRYPRPECGFPSIPLEDAFRGHSPEVLSMTHKAATTGRNSNRHPDNNSTVHAPSAAAKMQQNQSDVPGSRPTGHYRS